METNFGAIREGEAATVQHLLLRVIVSIEDDGRGRLRLRHPGPHQACSCLPTGGRGGPRPKEPPTHPRKSHPPPPPGGGGSKPPAIICPVTLQKISSAPSGGGGSPTLPEKTSLVRIIARRSASVVAASTSTGHSSGQMSIVAWEGDKKAQASE